jgi:hypothetical protein
MKGYSPRLPKQARYLQKRNELDRLWKSQNREM